MAWMYVSSNVYVGHAIQTAKFVTTKNNTDPAAAQPMIAKRERTVDFQVGFSVRFTATESDRERSQIPKQLETRRQLITLINTTEL